MSENSEKEHYFATRHARPAREAKEGDQVSKEYPDLTERGVEQAKERARNEILELVERAPEGAVIYIGGTSDQPRTKQTAEIYGDTLATLKTELGKENVIVITKSDIDQMIEENVSIVKVFERLRKMVEDNPDKKVAINYPLMLKELAFKYKNRWTDKEGKKTEYFAELSKKHGQNHEAAGEDWLANQGRLEVGGKVLQGPDPREVAEDYLKGLKRLRKFVEKNAPGRPVVVGEVGHQWDLDALVTYLANNGQVDYEGYKKVSQGQGIIKEAEMTEIIIDPHDPQKSLIKYRGKNIGQEKGVKSK